MRNCQTIELEKEMFVHIIIRVKIAVGSLADMKVDEQISGVTVIKEKVKINKYKVKCKISHPT